MLKNIFESVGAFLEAVICSALLVAATAVAVAVVFFVAMTCYRLIGSVWDHLFSQPWP